MVERFMDSYKLILSQLISVDELSEIDYTSDSDLNLLDSINDNERDLVYDDVLDAFNDVLSKYPDNNLVSYNDVSYSYGEGAFIASKVANALKRLSEVGLVCLYSVEGKPYLYLPTWEHHQTIRAKKSKYPEPVCEEETSEIICMQMNANVPVIQSNPIQSESNPNPIRNTEIPADEPKENKSKYSAECEEIISYLNSKAGTHYRNVDSNRKLITARMKEGYTVEDFKTVIDKKCDEWKGTDMQQFIRPVTLFQASKFENYLNAPVKKKQQNVVIPMPDFIKEQETAEREDKTPPWLVNRD